METCHRSIARPEDNYVPIAEDCDDRDASVNPDSLEVCKAIMSNNETSILNDSIFDGAAKDEPVTEDTAEDVRMLKKLVSQTSMTMMALEIIFRGGL